MKKCIVTLPLLLSFLLILSSCQSTQLPVSQPVTIAVSTIGPTHTWAEGVLAHAEDELRATAKENGWDYICKVADDSIRQSEQVIELIEQEVDCIIMLPMDGAALKTAAKSVQKAGIPLVIFDREIPDFAPTATVKGDNSGIGVKTAQIFMEKIPGGTKVLELMGDTSSVPFQRTDGYDDTISEVFEKEQVGYTGWQRDDSKNLFLTWVDEHSQQEMDVIGAVYTHDDEIALGVLDALNEMEEDSRQDKKFHSLQIIAGSSGSQEMFETIGQEKMYYLFSLTYSPSMVREAVRTGEKIIKGEDYLEMNVIETIKVDKDNYQEFVDPNSPF